MADFIAYSHSRLNLFNECPKHFWHLNIKKDVIFQQTDAMRAGEVAHKQLELRVSEARPFAPGYEKYEPIAQAVLRAPGKTFTELKMTIDRQFQPCGYSDWGRAYGRAIVDVMKINRDTAWAGDYKTGSPGYGSEKQLKLSSLFTFIHFPDVQRVTASYIWLKSNTMNHQVYERAQMDSMWADILPDVEALQTANRTQVWSARPSRRACSRCPVKAAGKCDYAV